MVKSSRQSICSFSDGFTFYPMPRPNFNFCDLHLSICKSEIYNFNNLGGKIGKVIFVGSIRLNKIKDENIEEKLLNKIYFYQKTILISSTQGLEKNISKNSKSYYGMGLIEKLNIFYEEIIFNALENKNFLYIIKEKKGELDLLDSEIFINLSKLDNISIVRCKHPTDLTANNFISLLRFSDLVISAAINSTTIFEALNLNKPVLIFKYLKFETPWDSFNQVIYNQGELAKKTEYFFKTDTAIINLIIKKLKNTFNIHNQASEKIILNLKNILIK